MEIIKLGTTSLPEDVLHEYLESMKLEYTPESYDLFLHNCNNFTADLSMFLCGVGIPEKIKNLPQEVLKTPFGQMMRPALEQQLRPITTMQTEPPRPAAPSRVKNVTAVQDLENIFKTAPAVVAFFTSATCAPCRVINPQFEKLATEAGEKAVFVKVDISRARDIAEKYQILATPTFSTWTRGEKLDEWKGASIDELKQKVDLLMRVTYPGALFPSKSFQTKPAHRHSPPSHEPEHPDDAQARAANDEQPHRLRQSPACRKGCLQARCCRHGPRSAITARIPSAPGSRRRCQRPDPQRAAMGGIHAKRLHHTISGHTIPTRGPLPHLPRRPPRLRLVRRRKRYPYPLSLTAPLLIRFRKSTQPSKPS
jgi:thiol-disulfide isomerase/thioredoxin